MSKWVDELHGGLGDKTKPNQVNQKQLKMGIKAESGEHTNNKHIAEEIAIDHLKEFPDYYTHLNKMEAQLEKSKKANIDIVVLNSWNRFKNYAI